jgi:hypothetical protein
MRVLTVSVTQRVRDATALANALHKRFEEMALASAPAARRLLGQRKNVSRAR